jgi:hypothetical protein
LQAWNSFCDAEWQQRPQLQTNTNIGADIPGASQAAEISDVMEPIPAVLSEVQQRLAGRGGSAKELKPALIGRTDLAGSRMLLSRSWSHLTAHAPDKDWAAPGDPRGQCGVSSLWLAEILARGYSISSRFCTGSVNFDKERAQDLQEHCWLEIDGISDDNLILDLTCDQAQGFTTKIVFDSRANLDRQRVHYVTNGLEDIGEPSHDLWLRYQMLVLNMMPRILATFGEPLPMLAGLGF